MKGIESFWFSVLVGLGTSFFLLSVTLPRSVVGGEGAAMKSKANIIFCETLSQKG